ncbi:YqcC family protein [Halomonas urumqiensis]|uniref:YqcC-like domain-containing protein n=1 Tax=Halomonas urumqiensis TaxID=1684789 RepID=A0A2N7UKS7_9GAMM|nr:YqcC family protein [Halomonas urumqiensis]PMR81053.1 hypothetical protein C1H70_06570 [Halomonas urumqiensis]PTB01090.1 YqcC family protein [Halomonas urumqiensis]GHE22815.1 hypothetical protein GCM10017767_33360 [Halomonas urumqiensis]
MSVHQELDTALRRLEATMMAANLWRMEPPSPDAYASEAPFCIDTMTMQQWLRFVFIARLDTLVEHRAAMPAKCEVAPAVDVYLAEKGISAAHRLLMQKAVEEVDRLVTEN